jgi:hypothetical protein
VIGVIGLPAPGLLFLLAAGFEVNAGIVAEARGGEAPVVPGSEPTAAVASTIAPAADVGLRQRVLELRLAYAPRIFWRRPNRFETERPLVLHNLGFDMQGQVARGSLLTGRASVAWGEADYSALPRLLGSGQSALPAPARILVATARTGSRLEMSRTWRLELGLEVEHRRPLGAATPMTAPPPDEPAAAPAPAFPQGTTWSFVPATTHRLTRRDRLIADSSVVYATYISGVEVLSWIPELSWERTLFRASDLRLGAGVAYTVDLGSPQDSQSSLGGWSPIADVLFNTRLLHRRGFELRGSAQAALDFVVDPVLATVGPRGMTLARLSLLFAPHWALGLEGLFATSLRSTPLPGTPDETVASLAVPVRRRLSENVVFEVGGRWSDRATHLQAANFSFHQRELWFYSSLTATTRREGRWATQ